MNNKYNCRFCNQLIPNGETCECKGAQTYIKQVLTQANRLEIKNPNYDMTFPIMQEVFSQDERIDQMYLSYKIGLIIGSSLKPISRSKTEI